MEFYHKAWYVAALADELRHDAILARTLLGTRVAMYRQADGSPVALFDRCPHRFAPLSRGTLIGDHLQCKYHGLSFDGTGHCVLNPHGDVIPPSAHVRAYPLAERYGLVWIWMGEADEAKVEDIPDLDVLQQTDEMMVAFNYIHTDYRYDILIDNLFDLSHADYLHVGSFSGGPAPETTMKVWEEGDQVVAERIQLGAPTPPMALFLGPLSHATFQMRWHPSQAIAYNVRFVSADSTISGEEVWRFAHIATPQDESHTHYFMALALPTDAKDPPIEVRAARQRSVVDQEDGPMLEAVHAEMDGAELMDMHPLVLPTDAASLRIRRVMKRLMKQASDA